MNNFLFALIAAVAGVAGSVQAAANAALASRIGLAAAVLVNTLVVLGAALIFYLVAGERGALFRSGAPWFVYVGGLCGFVILFSLAAAFPKIGATMAIALVVLGQGAAALAIDHFGVMGMPKDPVTPARLAGLLLVAGGITLIRL